MFDTATMHNIMDTQPTDFSKPSAEIQAVVMQLWNVVRETTQATSGAVAERNALQKKYATLEGALQQEQQKSHKMQHYIEHLEREAKAKEEEHTKLQQQHRDEQEISRHREETVQELRRSLEEKEELVSRLDAQVQEQGANIAARVGEIVAQEDELERLREELSASNDRAMISAQRLGELEPLYIEAQEEKAYFTEENERLRWQLTAVTEQTAQERTTLEQEFEKKLTDTRAENGRLLAETEEIKQDMKRLQSESEHRIRVLQEERDAAAETLNKATQDALTWQQIAEEQEQIFATKEQEFITKEQSLQAELERATSNAAMANADTERIQTLQQELQSVQNLLLLEKTAHEKTNSEAHTAHVQAMERIREVEAMLEMVRQELETAQNSTSIENAELTAMELAAKEAEFQAKLAEQQNAFNAALEQAKREAQIRLETELDATRHIMSMKDRELDLLRTNIETLQATNSRAAHDADERETRISELEALIVELETQRSTLENTSLGEHSSKTALNLPSMTDEEREALAEKIRQMLSRVEAALEEEVR